MNTYPPGLAPFPDALATALGQLMVRFQSLESTLVFAIIRFMHPGLNDVPPPLTMSVLYELPFRSLVKVFAVIPSVLPGSDLPFSRLKENNADTIGLLEAFATAAKLCTAAKERHNQLMHSTWLQLNFEPQDGSVLWVKISTNRKKGTVAMPVRESVETVSAAVDAINVAKTATFIASASINYFLFPDDGNAA